MQCSTFDLQHVTVRSCMDDSSIQGKAGVEARKEMALALRQRSGTMKAERSVCTVQRKERCTRARVRHRASTSKLLPEQSVTRVRCDVLSLSDKELNRLMLSLERDGNWRAAVHLFLQRVHAAEQGGGSEMPDTRVATSAIAILSRNCKPRSALAVLHWLENQPTRKPNVCSYTSAIQGLSRAGMWRDCRELLGQMRACGISPNKRTYTALLKACVSGGRDSLDFASQLLHDMDKERIVPDIPLLTAMVGVLGEAGNASGVKQIEHTMCTKPGRLDPQAQVALVRAHAKCGQLRRALRALRITSRNPPVHVYTALMQSLAKRGRLQRAAEVFQNMPDHSSAQPTGRMYTVAMHVFERMGHTAEVERLAREILSEHSSLFNVYHLNVLVSALGKAGRWSDALSWIERAKTMGVRPDRITHETIVLALGIGGEAEKAERYIERLESSSIPLRDYAYVGLIEALWRSGRWRDALDVRVRLRHVRVAESVHTYNALMQACEYARAWDKIIELYEDMTRAGIHPNNTTYALVGAAAERGARDVETHQQWGAAASAAAAAAASLLMRIGVF